MRPRKKFNDDARSLFIVASVKSSQKREKILMNRTSWQREGRKRAENGGAQKKVKRFHSNAHMGFIRFVYFTSSEVNNLFRLLIKPRVLFKMLRSAFARNKIWTNILLSSSLRLWRSEEETRAMATWASGSFTLLYTIFLYLFWRLLRR